MKWQPTEFRQRNNDARGDFAAKRTIQFVANRSSKQRAQTCSRSSTQTGTALLTTCGDCTTWLSISVGSHGPSSQNERGLKSEVKVREQSRPTNIQQSSLPSRTVNVGRFTSYSTKPEPRKRTEQTSEQRTSIGRLVF